MGSLGPCRAQDDADCGRRKSWFITESLRAGVRNASLKSLVGCALRMDLDVGMYDLGMYLASVIMHMLQGTAKTEEWLPDR
jgi:hypothetical protein